MSALELGPIDGVGVLGTGAAFPARVLDNLQVLQALKEPLFGDRARPADDDELRFVADSLQQTLGVRERAWSHLPGTPLHQPGEETSLDLATAAARAALRDAGIPEGEVCLVLCATSTPHRMTSTLSAQVATALGLDCAAMDTRTGCSGGLFALATAALFAREAHAPVVLAGVDTFSKVIPPRSRVAALSLGDGAGALVLGPRAGARLEAAFLRTDGALGNLITTDGALPPTREELDRGGYVLTGAPDTLTRVVPDKYAEAVGAVLARAKRSASDVAHYVPHQTSRALIAEVCRRTGLPAERAFVNVDRHANVGAAGWLVALHEARPRLRQGDLVLLAAVGGGMSWAAGLVTW